MSYSVRGLWLACALSLSFVAQGAEEAKSPFLKGNVAAGEAKAAVCSACHGPQGKSAMPDWPKLAAQGAVYTYHQLKSFKCPTDAAQAKAQKCSPRANAIMAGQVAALSDQDMQDLAVYYAAQEVSPGVASKDAVAVAEKIYRAGIPAKGVPACAACHGPTGAGNPAAGYPRVGGQHAAYNATQLKAYRSGERAADPNGLMMSQVAAQLSDEEIAALASYLNGLQ
jgi:cytochrome c553